VDEFGSNAGFAQGDLTHAAFAVVGTPLANQEIRARIRLDRYGVSQTGAWFGLVARYVDPRNHYYVTVRSSDQLQIRKQVNGVITVLASIPFKAAPSPGQYIEYRFRVINDQLQLFVDGELVASAHDAEIPQGRYGLATYRAAATWQYVLATQP
jgi:pectate lyase